MKIYTKTAGISICYHTDGNSRFSEQSQLFRGFACNPTDVADYNITVRMVQTPHIIDKSIGYLGEGENIGHTWHILHSDDKEIITTIFESSPTYLTARLTLDGNSGIMELCPTSFSTEQDVDAYIFPLYNLMITRLIHQRNGLLIHSSVVNDNGKGYLFTAVSGTGKSTMARIWQSCGATIVNDDMIALNTQQEEVITASNIAMPYYNASPAEVHLKGIFLISQSKTNFIRPVVGANAVLRLFSNTLYHALNKDVATRHLNIVKTIAARVPIFELGFKPDSDIVNEIRALNL